MVKKTEQIVEEQVNRWRLDLHEAKRTRRSRRPLPKAILLSNAYGSNAVPVARRVGEIMGFKVYDREIVDHIATHARIRIEVVETLDERAQSWIDDHITGLFREKSFYQDDYARELTRTIVSLWHHGPCVMVGHG
ncbi:MAG: cytidylate kinase-like family protein, partial [Polyangiaceae bacterium]|nr:cytidylate kinase-like family protein [Polyangiaceae bacterium]